LLACIPSGCFESRIVVSRGQASTLTARATTSPRIASETSDCVAIAIFVQGASGIASVGLKAVAFVKPEVEVVDEARAPAGRGDVRVELLWEGDVRVERQSVSPGGCAAAVELPVEEREGDVVRDPDDGSSLQQLGGGVRLGATGYERVDQQHGGRHGTDAQHGDEGDAGHAQLS
jgi:hypothetical protein